MKIFDKKMFFSTALFSAMFFASSTIFAAGTMTDTGCVVGKVLEKEVTIATNNSSYDHGIVEAGTRFSRVAAFDYTNAIASDVDTCMKAGVKMRIGIKNASSTKTVGPIDFLAARMLINNTETLSQDYNLDQPGAPSGNVKVKLFFDAKDPTVGVAQDFEHEYTFTVYAEAITQ